MKFKAIDTTMFGDGNNFTVVVEFVPNLFAKLFGAHNTIGRFYSNLGLTWVDLATNKAVERDSYGKFNWRLVDFLQHQAEATKEMARMLEHDVPRPEPEEETIH